ncbi:MAG: TIGR01777 family oxidoreductase [Anaerolineales bacterium]|nr:TIGR01777 family oxidoreductase [Anaerolineales bacterium]MCS7247096.1 TIGR01777 family oxidoreductase [Anaerolineales bacterium]MDW8160907.1 TIGR01777 family oxidoreductase [Anaerolineales bacterium]MDW8447059.1 TIGR01777 family oxidoreductase [Anaerolineales bacterium]
MRITIAGGTGFIGTVLTRELIQEGHQVVILTRSDPQRLQNRDAGGNPSFVQWDGENQGDWVSEIGRSHAVINLAGENIGGKSLAELITRRWTPERKQTLRRSRITSTKALVEAVKNSPTKPHTYIQASAVGYYGSHPEREMDENAPAGSDFLADLCVEWENASAELDRLGVRRVIVRIAGIVMSLEGGSLPFILLPYRFFLGGPLGNGKQWVSWIHIHDLVRAIKFLLEHPSAQGVFNLCAPEAVTNSQFSQILGRVLRKPSFFPTPTFLFRILFGEKADLLLASQKQIPKRLLDLGFEYHYPTVESALRNLLTAS